MLFQKKLRFALSASLVLISITINISAAQNSPKNGLSTALPSDITELRLFLTHEPNLVVGEIATSGPSTADKITVSMEEQTVNFYDNGIFPDQAKNDGVFTARFKLDTKTEFKRLRAELERTINLVRAPNENTFVRRGPRDIISADEAISDAERQSAHPLNEVRKLMERSSQLLNFDDPSVAAQSLNIDLAATPFLRIPGPDFDNLQTMRVKVDHLFNFPILDVFPPSSLPVTVTPEQSLLITATEIVNDSERSFDACSQIGTPGGVWSFGHLMRELAYGTGLSPEDFVQHWLSSWQMPQEVNGWPVYDETRRNRLQSIIIESWRSLSPATLSVDYFPARLLAIVNRPDLAGRIGDGAVGSAGEARFVFGLAIKDPSNLCNSLKFTMIFEYNIPASSCGEAKNWQQRWKDLDQLDTSSSAYKQALESITRAFTDHGSNPRQFPNASKLSQVRTNEGALGDPWQLREFRLQESGLFDLVTVKQTPDMQFESHDPLGTYLTTKENDILGDRHVVPDRFPTVLNPWLGAIANTPFAGFSWSAPHLDSLTNPAETRRKFSLSTCNGCHAGETVTSFTHIGSEGMRPMGAPAQISKFLSGETVTVPVSRGTHHYEDIAERTKAMSDILSKSCFRLLGFRKLPFVH
jgi:hypothetical protein